jgi:ribonuclease P protein component
LTGRRVRGCNSALFRSRSERSEAYLSAVESAPQAHAWFSGAEAHSRGTWSRARPPRKGARSIDRLIASPGKLPRSARLQRREHYQEALAAGAVQTRRYFRLYVRPNDLPHGRLGLIASSRVAPRAVDRNRFKRMARELFRGARERLGGLDVIVQLRRCPERGATPAARTELARVLEELAARTRAGQ